MSELGQGLWLRVSPAVLRETRLEIGGGVISVVEFFPMKRSNRRQEIRTELRQKLDSNFELFRKVAEASLVPKDDTCYQAGVNAFRDAIKYGSVFADLRRSEVFLRVAHANVNKAINEERYPAKLESPESLALEKCNAHFAYFATGLLLERRERPQRLDELEASVNAITSVLTVGKIAEVSADAARMSRSDADEWARYVARYIGLHVLCRIWGEALDASLVAPLSRSVSSKKYGELVDTLSVMASARSAAEMEFDAFDRVFAHHINLENCELSAVDGFLLPVAYIFSIIHSRGNLMHGVVTMFAY